MYVTYQTLRAASQIYVWPSQTLIIYFSYLYTTSQATKSTFQTQFQTPNATSLILEMTVEPLGIYSHFAGFYSDTSGLYISAYHAFTVPSMAYTVASHASIAATHDSIGTSTVTPDVYIGALYAPYTPLSLRHL